MQFLLLFYLVFFYYVWWRADCNIDIEGGVLICCSDFDDRFVHTHVIRQHYVFLVDTLVAKYSGLVGELYQAKVLSREEMESINCEVTSIIQNEKLLSVLSRKTKDQFDKFLDALDKTGQQHVRNHITGRQRQFYVFVVFCVVLF